MGGGSRGTASCGGEVHCAAAAMVQRSERGEENDEEDNVGCPAPLFMGVGDVRLTFLPRTFPVTAARINRARSALLR